MPVEPPDPILPQDIIATVSQPGATVENGHLVTDDKRHMFLAVEDGAWALVTTRTGTYHLTEATFGTLVGAEAQDPNAYKSAAGVRYTLHPASRAGVLYAEHVAVSSAQ